MRSHTPEDHVSMNLAAWNACHRAWHEARTAPNWYVPYQRGDHDFDDTELELLGDVAGLDVLQLSCAGDASQAFSFAVLGANVWACDFSPVAIEIAREGAATVGFDVTFAVDDAQRLATYEDDRFDLVHADYNLWYYEDLPLACRNWHRVLRPGGRLLLHEEHPITTWCLERDEADDAWRIRQSYDDSTPEYYTGEASGPFSHGDPSLEAVEFPHTTADIVNAVCASGLVVERFVERCRENTKETARGVLPSDLFILARKP